MAAEESSFNEPQIFTDLHGFTIFDMGNAWGPSATFILQAPWENAEIRIKELPIGHIALSQGAWRIKVQRAALAHAFEEGSVKICENLWSKFSACWPT